jgi:hypothetical protein
VDAILDRVRANQDCLQEGAQSYKKTLQGIWVLAIQLLRS